MGGAARGRGHVWVRRLLYGACVVAGDGRRGAPEPRPAPSATGRPGESKLPADRELRQQLEGLRLKELRARARLVDAGAEAMTAAMDSGDPKAALVEALVARREA